MTRQNKTISDKNTKQDILTAYQELLSELEHQPLTQSSLSQIEKHDKTLVNDLQEMIKRLQVGLQQALDDITNKFSDAERVQSLIKEMHDNQKKMMIEEKQALLKTQDRDKEEYAYEFAKQKKRQEEELALLRQKAETELTEKREKLKTQEEELNDLRNQVKTFDTRLQKGINDEVSQATNDLRRTFDHEKTLLTQEAKLTQGLLEQKIALLEQTLDRQTKEMDRLNSVASLSAQQMTRIAERAVTKTSEFQPQTPVKSSG